MATTIEAGWANPTDRLASYPVDMKCGHVEMRKMRPSTARAVITADGLIHSAELCRECSATRDAIAIPALVKRMGWDDPAPGGWDSVEGGARLGDDEVGVTGEVRSDDYDHGAMEDDGLPHDHAYTPLFPGAQCQICGLWEVYHDEAQARLKARLAEPLEV